MYQVKSFSFYKHRIRISKRLCVDCGRCVGLCQYGALGFKDGRVVMLKRQNCAGCLLCVGNCPTGAISYESEFCPRT